MSREIKFRAWDTKQRYMLQKSVLVFTHSVGTSVMLNLKHSEVPYLPGKSWYRDNFHNYYSDDGSVIPMQYTGLKDKNGVEIYESDIVQWPGDEGVAYDYEVEWIDGGWFMSDGQWLSDINDVVSVIGNKYEIR